MTLSQKKLRRKLEILLLNENRVLKMVKLRGENKLRMVSLIASYHIHDSKQFWQAGKMSKILSEIDVDAEEIRGSIFKKAPSKI